MTGSGLREEPSLSVRLRERRSSTTVDLPAANQSVELDAYVPGELALVQESPLCSQGRARRLGWKPPRHEPDPPAIAYPPQPGGEARIAFRLPVRKRPPLRIEQSRPPYVQI